MGSLKKGWRDFLLAINLANKAEQSCKELWQLFLFPFLAGVFLQSFILFSLSGWMWTTTGLFLVFLVVMYVWCFWLEIGIMIERAKSLVVDQIIMDMENQQTPQKEGPKEKHPTLH